MVGQVTRPGVLPEINCRLPFQHGGKPTFPFEKSLGVTTLSRRVSGLATPLNFQRLCY